MLLYTALQFYSWRRQRAKGLTAQPLALVVARVVLIAVIVLGVTAVLNIDRALAATVNLAGIPYAIPIVLVLLFVLTFVLSRTGYGRHVYAVGGNAEAARRAGINVTRIRVSVFVIGSSMAAVSGIAAASRLGVGDARIRGRATPCSTPSARRSSVAPASSAGAGKVRDAVLGGLVIAIIANGLGLLGVQAYLNFIITGGVLLLAASVDALARRRSIAGR